MDNDGRLTAEITDFAGMYVKEADKEIVAKIKAMGRLVEAAVLNHSYPFCWRSETPLIYRVRFMPIWAVHSAHVPGITSLTPPSPARRAQVFLNELKLHQVEIEAALLDTRS